MRHRNAGRKLSRNSAHRKALMRNIVTSLLEIEQVKTTLAKAKEARIVVDRMITLGKKGGLASIRRAAGFIRKKSVVTKLFGPLAKRYEDRKGGYTRILKLGTPRAGDSAPLAMLELVDRDQSAMPKRRTKHVAQKTEGKEKTA